MKGDYVCGASFSRPSALHFDALESSSEAGADEVSLEALLNRFCKYAKTTESARSLAEQAKDMGIVRLLDQMLSLVNEAALLFESVPAPLWRSVKNVQRSESVDVLGNGEG